MRRLPFLPSMWVGLIVFALTCSSVWGQATAQISGAARDSSGAVLPGVEVTATQTNTGISRSAITSETGSYILPNLALGSYRLEATLLGFRTFVQTGINLQVDSNPVINVVLEVGQVTEHVEVQANVAQVETRSSAVGAVIENQRILDLPLNGRSVMDLITLSGASVQITGCTRCGSGNSAWQGGQTISMVGGTIYGNEFTLDGGAHSNVFDGSQMPLPFPDALEEFRVDVVGTPASGARLRSGGVVSSVTKAGTNEYHGDLFEFVRNGMFNARNAYAAKRDSLKRNQFGGTLGGPIMRNKLFFFGGYQGTKTRSDPSETFAFVPTPAVLAGDFTGVASADCNAGRQITLRAPFVNNRIDPALFIKPALNIAARLPKQILDPCGKVLFGYTDQIDEMQAVGKIDYQLNVKHSVFGRYIATTYQMKNPYSISKNVLATVDEAGRDDLAQSFALGSTYLFSSSTINAFRIAINRAAVHRLGPDTKLGPQEIGINSYTSFPGNTRISVQGGPAFFIGSTSFSDGTFPATSGGITDDVSLVRQNHQFTVGASVLYGALMERAHSASIGTYLFDGSVTGLGMADLFLGQLRSLVEGSVTLWTNRSKYVSAYASDVWQVKRGLSLSYGLRWEPNLSIDKTEGVRLNHFSSDNYQKGIKSKVYPQAPAGLFFQGDQWWEPKGRGSHLPDWWNFSPRIGVAWDVKGDGRTSLRGSYGISHEMAGPLGGIYGGSGASYTVNNPSGGFVNPWSDFPGGNPFPIDPADPGTFPIQVNSTIGSFHRPQPKSQYWNVSIQKQTPADFLVSASYIGRRGSSTWRTRGLNDPVFVPGVGDANRNCFYNGKAVPYTVNPGAACSTTANVENRRPLTLQDPRSTLGNIILNVDDANTYYHALLVSVQRRAAKGVTIGLNHTWAHCINDAVKNDARASFVLDADPLTKVLPLEYSNCDSDVRHIFNFTSIATAPNFSNRTLHLLITGWQASGIFRRNTGLHYSLVSGTSRSLGAVTAERLNQILPNAYLDKNGKNIQYLNPAAFAVPDIGTGGNLGANTIEGPPSWTLDLGLSRTFQVGESQKFELRAEAFNVPNSLRRQITVVGGRDRPSLSFSSNTFGQLNTSGDPRIIQFALKYIF